MIQNKIELKIDKEDLKLLESINKKVKKSHQVFKTRMNDFESFLIDYPMLGMKHELGRKIFESIEINKWTLLSPSFSNLEYYRAFNVKDKKILTKKVFEMPKIGLTNFGRFNLSGQLAYYLSSTKEGACEEVIQSEGESLIWVSKIEFDKLPPKIADLRIDPLNYDETSNLIQIAICDLGFIRKKTRKENRNWKPEYHLTNFLADCFKHSGYNGIIYTSSKYHCDNLVLFGNSEIAISKIQKPEIIKYQRKKLNKILQKHFK